MKDLMTFLKGIGNKTGLTTKLLAFLIGLNLILPAYVGPEVMLWVDFVGSLALLFFKIFAPSGNLPKGWTFWFYVTNGCFFAISGLDLLGQIATLDPVILAKIIASINGISAVAQFLNGSPAAKIAKA